MWRFALLTLPIIAAACAPAAPQRPTVFAAIPPVAYLAERIGGDAFAVETLLKPGHDPHVYEPSPQQVRSLGRAVLYLKVGLPFEEQLVRRILAMQEDFPVIDVTQGIAKLPLDEHGHHDHAAGKDEPHPEHAAEAAVDPHVWLSPANLEHMADAVAEALCRADPPRAGQFRSRLAEVKAEIEAADAANRRRLKPYAGRAFYVFHPAFAYFADHYGLRQVAVEAGGKAPSPKQLRELIHSAAADRVTVLFIQPQFNPESARRVAESLDARVEPLNDLADDPIANLAAMGVALERAFREQRTDQKRRP